MSRFERDHKHTTSADKHYLSSKEIKEIAKANAKVMKELEKKKYRKNHQKQTIKKFF